MILISHLSAFWHLTFYPICRDSVLYVLGFWHQLCLCQNPQGLPHIHWPINMPTISTTNFSISRKLQKQKHIWSDTATATVSILPGSNLISTDQSQKPKTNPSIAHPIIFYRHPLGRLIYFILSDNTTYIIITVYIPSMASDHDNQIPSLEPNVPSILLSKSQHFFRGVYLLTTHIDVSTFQRYLHIDQHFFTDQ